MYFLLHSLAGCLTATAYLVSRPVSPIYSFSFSQNKMDCSLTKTVNRRTAKAANTYSVAERELHTANTCMYVRTAYACPMVVSLALHTGARYFGIHSCSARTLDVNQWRILQPMLTAARLLKNSQNRYEYNAFTLFTHSLARSCTSTYSHSHSFVVGRTLSSTVYPLPAVCYGLSGSTKTSGLLSSKSQ